MRKRLREERSLCGCKSPRLLTFSTPRSSFSFSFQWFEEDVWTEIAKWLDGKSVVKLGATCRWFNGVMMQDIIWRYACLRDLQVPPPTRPLNFKWSHIYASLANGSHSYKFQQVDKHIDWMRIGAFSFDSQSAMLTNSLKLPLKIRKQETTQKVLESCGACVLHNIRTGIWIADLQLVRCPVCELQDCEGKQLIVSGTMQILDVRNIELFLFEEFRNGTWEYETLGSHKVEKSIDSASGAIFDLKHLKERATAGVFNSKAWAGKPDDFQPKAMITFHNVAISTNLQANQGLLTNFYVMKAGSDGQIVSIRICQQLL